MKKPRPSLRITFMACTLRMHKQCAGTYTVDDRTGAMASCNCRCHKKGKK